MPQKDSSSRIISADDLIKQVRRDFLEILQGFDNNLDVLEKAFADTQDVIAILEETGGLTVRARNMMQEKNGKEQYAVQIAEAQEKFGRTLAKLDERINAVHQNGINLLEGDSITIRFDTKGLSNLTFQGMDLRADSLGFRKPDFSDLHGIQNSRIDVANAIDLAVTLRNMVSSDIAVIQTRREFCETALALLSLAQEQNDSPPIDIEHFMSIRPSSDDNEFLAGGAQAQLLGYFKHAL